MTRPRLLLLALISALLLACVSYVDQRRTSRVSVIIDNNSWDAVTVYLEPIGKRLASCDGKTRCEVKLPTYACDGEPHFVVSYREFDWLREFGRLALQGTCDVDAWVFSIGLQPQFTTLFPSPAVYR